MQSRWRGSGFNPRSREGSDLVRNFTKLVSYTVSIHAPAKGATNTIDPYQIYWHCFNPRSREGSDGNAWFLQKSRAVSIHAPAKGATTEIAYSDDDGLFQSTLPRRERLAALILITSILSFQSTLPRRERHSISGSRYPVGHGFNPRSREGSDAYRCIILSKEVSFNPRSREGSDSLGVNDPDFCLTFQSTLPRRERLHGDIFDLISGVFQSTLPRRERPTRHI